MERIYLDNNATTLLDPRVVKAMSEELAYGPANPSSIHFEGREAKNRLNRARRTIADYLNGYPNNFENWKLDKEAPQNSDLERATIAREQGASEDQNFVVKPTLSKTNFRSCLGIKPAELFFSSSGTESINMILRTLHGGHIITSDIEHSAIYKTVQMLEKKGCTATYLSAGLKGSIECEELKKAIKTDTKIIILSAVNNETGVKNPIEEAAKIAKEAGIPFIVDAVCLLGKEPITLHDGISGMVFAAHKLHGPKGVGLAWIHPRFKFEPLILGGEQEFSKRAGTENLLGIIGFAKAVELLKEELPEAALRMEKLRDRFEKGLQDKLPHLLINGEGPRVVNTSNLSFMGVDGEALLMKLDMHRIAASHGSACSSGALEPSRVLRNMGFSKERSSCAIRFSLSRFTTEEEINQAIQLIASLALI